MNTKAYQWILYTIVIVILATISIQIYWNYKNYQSAKQGLVIDVQISLDKAVDDYFAIIAEETTLGFSLEDEDQKNIFDENSLFKSIIETIDEDGKKFTNLDTLNTEKFKDVKILRGRAVDSMMNDYRAKEKPISTDSLKNLIENYKKENLEIKTNDISLLTSKVTISITNDSLDIYRLDTILSQEFKRKNINVDYALFYKKVKNYDTIRLHTDDSFLTEVNPTDVLQTSSNSPYLPKKSELNLKFSNSSLDIINRIIAGIILSLVLILVVIACLFYLLKIIRNQKELAEIKNDLISNITHEFKTPIATISAALEGISSFNAANDKVKTKKYVDISSVHLSKLNTMVEKILEISTLESDNLHLNLQPTKIVTLLKNMVSTYQNQFSEKTFHFNFEFKELEIEVDQFHFENALNNILDNAVKYGGKLISIGLSLKNEKLIIIISDDGKNLNKSQKQKIFDKFYRVPKGNKHDVKGFGIGLYYTKSIIEKHQGTIEADVSEQLTSFIITMPYVR